MSLSFDDICGKLPDAWPEEIDQVEQPEAQMDFLPDIENHQTIKRPRSWQENYPAKRSRVAIPELFDDLWRPIIKLALDVPEMKWFINIVDVPEGRSLMLLSAVCKQWQRVCEQIKLLLINEGVPLRRIFNCISVPRPISRSSEISDNGVSLFIKTDFFKNYGAQLQCLHLYGRVTDAEFELVTAPLTQLQRLDLGAHNFSPQALMSISRLTSLTCLNLRHREIPSLSMFASLTKLQTLDLSGCTITSEELETLASLTRLEELDFSNCVVPILNTKPQFLVQLTRLQRLNLENSGITDAGIGAVASLVQLQYLNLNETAITDAGLKMLTSLVQLQDLEAVRCEGITDEGLGEIASLSQLHTLNVMGCEDITDASLQAISSRLQMRSLCLVECSRITDVGLRCIAQMTTLESLNFTWCPLITDEGVRCIAGLSLLRELQLSGDDLTDEGLGAIAPLTQLVELAVWNCPKITVNGLAAIAQLTQLQSLTLYTINVTNGGLFWIAHLKNLVNLELSYCNHITDGGLWSIALLPKLEYLNFDCCPQITPEGIKAIKWPKNLVIHGV